MWVDDPTFTTGEWREAKIPHFCPLPLMLSPPQMLADYGLTPSVIEVYAAVILAVFVGAAVSIV